MMLSGQSSIELRNLTKQFALASGVFTALSDINVNFRSGEFTSVVGRSGSGKSTLMNMITGIDRPSSGEVIVDGKPIHSLSETKRARWRGRNLGIVFQFYQLIPVMSLLENVMLPMQILGEKDLAVCEARALDLLDSVGLRAQAGMRPSRVSGGEQQCAAIARSLANDPSILLADEPTGNLGSSEASMILEIFTQLVDQGKTVIMVTHDSDLAARSHRILQLSDGKLISDQQILPIVKKRKKHRNDN